jgi:cell division protein FtsB
MPDEKALAGKSVAASGEAAVRIPLSWRAVKFAGRAWRPAATVVVVMLMLLLGWHAFYGKNGVSVWERKRVEDRQLRKEIDDLQQENSRLRTRIEQLKTNPDAIGQVARDKLHYTKPNEVIVTLPPEPQKQSQSAGTGK